MPSRYSVIQYVPNPIANERINIGVLAFDDENIKVYFLSSWDRVRCFGNLEDLGFVKNFAHRMQKAVHQGLLFPGDEQTTIPRHERLLKVTQGWMNSIQFTNPRSSLEDVDSLLEDIIDTYLLEPSPKKPKPRDRQAAAKVATSSIRDVLKDRFGIERAKELLKQDYELTGGHEKHIFDVTVANGHPIFAAHGISFEVDTPESLLKSLSWMIVDIKEAKPNFPLAVVALPPSQKTSDRQTLEKRYRKTIETYKSLGAKVLNEDQVKTWASQQLSV